MYRTSYLSLVQYWCTELVVLYYSTVQYRRTDPVTSHLDTDTGVEVEKVRHEAGVCHHLEMSPGDPVTKVQKCVLLLLPQTLDPAPH